MKKLTQTIIVFLLIAVLPVIAAREQLDEIVNIENAIKSGDAVVLKNFFNSTIDLVVPGNEGTFSKTQAEQIMKKFFTQYSPTAYVRKQQGASQGGATFVIGSLTAAGKNFRVYFLMKKTGNVMLIQQLQIEES